MSSTIRVTTSLCCSASGNPTIMGGTFRRGAHVSGLFRGVSASQRRCTEKCCAVMPAPSAGATPTMPPPRSSTLRRIRRESDSRYAGASSCFGRRTRQIESDITLVSDRRLHGVTLIARTRCGQQLGACGRVAECYRVPLRAIDYHLLPPRSFAECLPSGILRRLSGLREITKSLQTSVKKLVDRSGFEPLTSAVQRRQQ